MQQTDQKKSDRYVPMSEQFLKDLSGLKAEEQVEELAALFFTVSEIAVFTGMDADRLRNTIMSERDSEMSKAYNRGKLRTRIMLRFDSRNFALKGSPQALQEMKEYMSDQQIDENA